jgi:hypothetical protein
MRAMLEAQCGGDLLVGQPSFNVFPCLRHFELCAGHAWGVVSRHSRKNCSRGRMLTWHASAKALTRFVVVETCAAVGGRLHCEKNGKHGLELV